MTATIINPTETHVEHQGLVVHDLNTTFGTAKPVHAVRGVSLDIEPGTTFVQAMDISTFLLLGRILGWFMVGIAHLVFGLHFLLMLLRIGQPGGEPTLFAPIGEEEKH